MNAKITGTILGIIGSALWFMPLVYVSFMDINTYQAGNHIGGIAYLILLASLAYALLSWMELHLPRIIAASTATMIAVILLVGAGPWAGWGLIGLTFVSMVCFVVAVRDNRSSRAARN